MRDTELIVVCICGSTRFKKEIESANRKFTLEGKVVLAPGVFAHSGDRISEVQKIRLDALHKVKISISDEIFVVNPGGYIGKSTQSEIDYARRIERPVRFSVSPP